ncbi:MAG: hypothetical protein ACREVE_11390 [Gammaproteobacteria bacterium]
MSQINEATQTRRATNRFAPSLAAAGCALLIGLAITACEQQEDAVEGQVPTGQEDAATEPAPDQGMQQPGTGEKQRMQGARQVPKPTAPRPGSMADAPPSPAFKALDGNGDGLVSAKEAKQNPELGGRFGELDTNGDLQLDKKEFAAFASGKMGGKPAGKKTGGSAQPSGESDQSGGSVENPNRPSD